MNLARPDGEFLLLASSGLGALSPEMLEWRNEHIRSVMRRWGEIEVLAETVPATKVIQVSRLLDTWELEVERVIRVFNKATTETEISVGSRIYAKIDSWRQQLLSLGAEDLEEVEFRWTSTTSPSADPVSPEVSSGTSGWLWAGLAFGAVGLYLLWRQ